MPDLFFYGMILETSIETNSRRLMKRVKDNRLEVEQRHSIL